MARIAKIILVIWLVITLGLALLAGLTQFNDTEAAEGLARTADPTVMFGPGRSSVRLDFTPDTIDCPAIPLSIILLLDKSDSMVDGNAFISARQAAESFINDVDLTHSTVAVAYFDDTMLLVQTATQDTAALLSAIRQVSSPGGGTNITGALQLAADNPGPGRPVVILLTDGGAHDPEGAMSAATALKSTGAHIITIAVGPFADLAFLRDLATSPTSALTSDDPADLQAIYTDLAGQLSAIAATGLTLTEPVAEAFAIAPDSIDPPATQIGNDLIWTSGLVPAAGASYAYDVTTEGPGWRTITAEAATMSFIDCQTGLTSLSLGAGPRILVLPGPAFWIPWLLALLLPVFLLFRSRKPDRDDRSQPAVAPVPPPAPAPDPNPAWLRRLDGTEKMLGLVGVEVESGDLVPTIIVGLGPVGRIVLSQVAQALNGRFTRRGDLPVRLLQIDVQPQTGAAPQPPDYLLPDEWVLLRPNYTEISRTLQSYPEQWSHMDWYEPTAAAEYGRARGRMALFYDLRNGADNSTLYRGLKRTAQGMDKPRLRVVGSTFDDVAAGMLIDISWLMWLVTRRNVDVELWLTGPLNRDWSPRLDNPARTVSQFEQRARTLATLREIERFQRNAIVPLHYVPREMGQEEFHQEVDSAVVQTLFLFEAPPGATNIDDHLATLTDSLVALLNPNVQKEVTEHLSRFQADAGAMANMAAQGLVCGMGAYAVATPLAPLREALAWRLVHDLVCEARTGLMPAQRLKSDGTYEEQTPGAGGVSREDVEAFITTHRTRLNDASFLQAVAARVADTLNGEDGDLPPLARSGGIRRARKWLEMLRNVLNQQGQSTAAAPLSSLIRELEEWDNFLIRQLCPAAGERLRAARERLKALTTQGGRAWSIDAQLEWPAYRTGMRSWLDQPSSAGSGEAIVRAAQRFGWQVTYDPVARAWPVELWIPDGEYVWAGRPPATGEMVAPRDAAAILDRLYKLAVPLAHNAGERADALTRAADMANTSWLEAAKPRLGVNEMIVTRFLAGANSILSLLAARETDTTVKVREALGSTGDAQKVVGCAIEDRTTVTLLRVRDRVPLSAVHLYGDDRDGNNAWDANAVSSAHYVWRGEQVAAAHETGERMGSRFVGYLERDEYLVDLYARAVLIGLFGESMDGVEIIGANGWAWPGSSAGEALVNLFSTSDNSAIPALRRSGERQRAEAYQAVEEAIAQSMERIESSPGMAGFRREAERVLRKQPRPRHELDSVEPWQRDYEEYFLSLAADRTPEDRDLRLYMLHILSTL